MVFYSYVYDSALSELFESKMKAHCAVCAPIPAHFRILKCQLDIVYVRSLHFYGFRRQIKVPENCLTVWICMFMVQKI